MYETELLTAAAVSRLLGSMSKNPRQLANRWRVSGRLLGVPHRNQYLYPAFQVDAKHMRLRDAAAEVNLLLGATSDPWVEQRRLPPTAGIEGEPVRSRLAAGSSVWRIHAAGRDACEFNHDAPDRLRGGRFDSPSGSPGVLYASDTYQGAIAEVLLRDVLLADEGVRAVLVCQVRGRLLSRLEVVRDIELVALHGAAAASVGQGLWLTKSDSADYPFTREWGAVIRTRAPDAAGFVWRARHDEDRLAYALYDNTAADALKVVASVAIGEGTGLEAVRSVLLGYRAVIEG